MAHVVSSWHEEVIHHSEHECGGKCRGDYPVSRPVSDSHHGKTHKRSSQDDDKNEQSGGGTERYVSPLVGSTMRERDDEVCSNNQRQPPLVGHGCQLHAA